MCAGQQHNSSSLWLRGLPRSEGRGTSCQSCRLQASDCKARMEACNFRWLSVHVPTVISTPQCGGGHNSVLPLKAVPQIQDPTLSPCCDDHISAETGWNNSGPFGECRQFVTANIAEHEHICIFIICKTVALPQKKENYSRE